jgi:photosystem II stability/assembly factor-like uncharacterized protein
MRTLLLLLALSLCLPQFSQAQRRNRRNPQPVDTWKPLSDTLFQAMKWRNVGPFRGGRSTAVCGVPSHPHLYYMGTVGGGLWRTEDAGVSWRNISDGYFKTGSVGAVAVANSDPNVIYVGMGEAPVRGVMTSHGDGVYKSTDAGKTWAHVGLNRVRQISKVRIHPDNPDVVYVAAQGSPYAPTEERGIYRSLDGGANWDLVLHVDERTGASDLSLDATNPRILYAAFWEHQRLPWQVVSGGPGSSIWKSTNGGETWIKLEKGLPDGIMGKIGVSVSPANPQRVWAIIESEKGGLYRSDNGGKNWQLINPDRVLRARSWYYMHVFADTRDPETVYVLNAPVMKSIDGGKTFQPIPTPHGDNHDLWIHPENNQVMINANDGGGNISFNGGKTWSSQSNQPTAQFYRVNADNRFPYWIYGGQQDNSTVAIPNQVNGRGIQNSDFHSVGGCESAFCAFDPDNPRFVYAGCYQGIIDEYDQELEQSKDVMAYPYLGLGTTPAEVKYRFNWNAPILVSQHDPSVIYHCGNQVLKSTNRGLSWEEVSPDLTRNIDEHLGKGGAPITNEGAGGEVYHTLMYLAEDPEDANTLWAGADDGLLHITRDGGENWTPITPPNVGEGMINCIELSTHQAGTAYIAFTRYKFNDFTPHVYVTTDYGQTWTDKTTGIGAEAHVRVVRHDPVREGLLYAGTETGLYVSFDNGDHWQPFQRNLPVVPITDLKVHHNDLIAATQGRAFWVLDDLTPLHQMDEDMIMDSRAFLYQPRDPHLFGGPRVDSMPDRGTNPDFGAVLYYQLQVPDSGASELTVEFLDASGEVLRSFSSTEKSPAKKASRQTGMNKLVWNLRLPNVESPKGLTVLGGTGGYRVGPGNYQARLIYGADTLLRSFTVKPDPRQTARVGDYAEKNQFAEQLYAARKEVYKAVLDMRHVKSQIEALNQRLDEESEAQKALKEEGAALIAEMDSLEATLIQTEQKTFQDVINYPNQLDALLGHIQSTIDGATPPLTEGQKQRAEDMLGAWEEKEEVIDELLGERLDAFNEKVKEAEVPFVGRRE